MGKRVFLMALIALTQAACFTSVSENEHCLEVRYGKPVNPKMSSGLNATIMTDAICFPLTDNQPDSAIRFAAMTKDSIQVNGLFYWVWAHNSSEIPALYRAKGNRDAAEAEIYQGALTGLQRAISKFTSDELYAKPGAVDYSIKAEIDTVQQGRAITRRAFVRNIQLPAAILQARQELQKRDLALRAAQRQLAVDSMTARGRVINATAIAEAKRLEAQSYAANPQLLQLEAAKAMANGLANVCKASSTCIIGGSVMDAWRPGVR